MKEIDARTFARARRGDDRAFTALVRHYDDGLRALAFRLLGDRTRMDDALQEAYVSRITVDRRSGMPVQIVETKHGAVLSTLRIENLMIDPAFPADEFRLAFPAGAEVMRSDDGFQTVPLDDAAATAGYAPLVPSWVPAGYELADVAVARESAPTGSDSGNPPSRMVVSLSYRRGLDRFLVTTRLRGDSAWSDPLASPVGFVDTPEHVSLTTGALAGTDAQVVLSPNTVPHLWALTPDLVVTVGGDLTRQELVRVVGSIGNH